ncbi:spike base protein, RCAP_Rcc01079 family [Chachezhania sediminis]|uniref:spike base protein, RCAP_Rcc01079 family n=1 Tax=Chachezhania sediminis TaxID=2599291 RepID=UPI00131C9B0F|nr:hypothetical protein [Chachezhania sediminis]
MADQFSRYTPGLESPPLGGFAITPDDASDLPTATRGINAGVAGTVHLTTIDGSDITLHVAAGMIMPVRAARIWATGTSALSLTGLY